MAKHIFTFVSDAGHGWLKAPISLIKKLGIVNDISVYSYLDKQNKMVYLEEDCDASVFIEKLKAAGHTVELKIKNVEWAACRKMNSYNPIRVL